MKDLLRVFDYIWKQWHRLVLIFFCAAVIALLYLFSLAAISPLLTVIMGDEGLKGWVNRKVASARYGMTFYNINPIDISDPNKPQASYYIQVAKVNRKGIADLAGVKRDDKIVNVRQTHFDHNDPSLRMPSAQILDALTIAQDNQSLVIQLQRHDKLGLPQNMIININSGKAPFYAPWANSIVRRIPITEGRESKEKAFLVILIFALVATIIRCFAKFVQDYLAQKVVFSSLTYIREDAFKHSLEIPVGFFMREGASDSVSRLVRDTNEIGGGLKLLFGNALREPLKAIALVSGAFMIHRNMTLIFLSSAPVAIIIIGNLGKKIRRFTKKSLANWAIILGKLEEAFAAIKVVKVYNQEGYEYVNFRKRNRTQLKHQLRIAKIDAAAEPLLEVVGMFAAVGVLFLGASWVLDGSMPESDFFTLLFFLGGAAESIRRISGSWNKVEQANAAAMRVYSLIDQKPETENPDAFELAPLKNNIQFKNLRFTYPGTDKPVLKDVNLSIQAGHNVAIVGPNGSGKTTLTNLIPRFYDPDQGQVLIDGKDIRNATLLSLRNLLGFVTQNVVTFNDTIAANIGYGKKNATMDEIIDAAKRAYAHEFIEPLPKGYDTVIGEQGAGLSGGQLQRIVIARAIVRNPSILIFDEATSQVDADSEAKIHKAIEEVMRDRTSIIIAHRFSTVAGADMIVVMDHGQIVAKGRHEELIKNCGLYQNLYENQLART